MIELVYFLVIILFAIFFKNYIVWIVKSVRKTSENEKIKELEKEIEELKNQKQD